MTGKTAFIEKIVADLEKKALIVDFDTQFTALKANGYLSAIFYESNGPEIFLPDLVFPSEIVDKILHTLKLNETIILDSLNGLMDYFNSKLIRGKKTFSNPENFKIKRIESNYRQGNNSIGHLTLFLLKMLFASPLIDRVSIILTSYIPQQSAEGLGIRLINLERNLFASGTHFERLSQSIAVLRYDHDKKRLFYTRILNTRNFPERSRVLDYPKTFQLK